jgi:CRP-like cAMP-binding protein
VLVASALRTVLPQDDVRALVQENYPSIASTLLNPLLNLLTMAREACGGDSDKFLIMLVVGIRSTEHRDFARYSQDELLSGQVPVFPTLGTNVRSIADSLGVPRETVRRKLAELTTAGWVVRHDNEICFTAEAYQQLAKVREGLEQLAVSNFEAVSRLLDQRA